MKPVDFNNIQSLKQFGFEGFVQFEELQNSPQLPMSNGVYMILRTKEDKVSFLVEGSGGYFKGKNPNVSIDELKRNWVENTKVLYIGKASNLKSRLSAYKKFGEGKNIGHYGGRYIWQVKNAMTDLIVCWKTTNEGNEDIIESELICHFRDQYGQRPFANLTK